MDKDAEDLFVEIALEKGLLTREQVGELREEAARLEPMGAAVSQIARARGLLSAAQIIEIRKEMQKHGVLPRLGGYEIISRLGKGGMGAVYKARQTSLDRLVALKILPWEVTQDEAHIERFEREARLAARIAHPNLIQVYDRGLSAGRRYIAMEFVGGSSVGRLLRSGPLPVRRALEIVLGVARGLGAAHKMGIIHHDVKPSNIMLTDTGMAKLSDLGLARELEATESAVTAGGAIMGTPQYMAPEICGDSGEVDGRADIYSLGITLFHMVCGRIPFQGDSVGKMLRQHAKTPLPDPRVFREDLPDEVVALIRRMTEKRPGDRFQDCDALIGAIEAVMRGAAPWAGPAVEPKAALAGSSAETAGRGAWPLRRIVIAMGVLCALAVILAMAISLARKRAGGRGAREEAALLARYNTQLAAAEGDTAAGRWEEARAAWVNLRAIGEELRTKPESFATIDARLESIEREEGAQRALLRRYEAKLAEAESLVSGGRFGEALVAWAELRTIGEAMRETPVSFAGIEGRMAMTRAALERERRPSRESRAPSSAPKVRAPTGAELRAKVEAALQRKGRFVFTGIRLEDAVGRLAARAGVAARHPPALKTAMDVKVYTVLPNEAIAAGLETLLRPRGLSYRVTAEGILIVKGAAASSDSGGVTRQPAAELIISAGTGAPQSVPLSFKKGEYAVMQVGGFWSYGPLATRGAVGPQGNWRHVVGGRPMGALLVEIRAGDLREKHVVERLSVVKFEADGDLSLGMNDDDFGDNEGRLHVGVEKASSAQAVRGIIRNLTGKGSHRCTVFVMADEVCTVYVNGRMALETGEAARGRVHAFETELRNGDVIAVSGRDKGGRGGVCVWIETPGFMPIATDGTWRFSMVGSRGWTRRRWNERGWRPAVYASLGEGFVSAAFGAGVGGVTVLPLWGGASQVFLRKRVSFRRERYLVRSAPSEGRTKESEAVITVACDDVYALYVNGGLIGVGGYRRPGVYRVPLKRGDIVAVHGYDQNDGMRGACGLALSAALPGGGVFCTDKRWQWSDAPGANWRLQSGSTRGWRRVRVESESREDMRETLRGVVGNTGAEVIWGEGADCFFRCRVR